MRRLPTRRLVINNGMHPTADTEVGKIPVKVWGCG